jgi:hypothetical protein
MILLLSYWSTSWQWCALLFLCLGCDNNLLIAYFIFAFVWLIEYVIEYLTCILYLIWYLCVGICYIFKIKLCSFKLFNVFFSKELFNVSSHTLHLQHIPSYALIEYLTCILYLIWYLCVGICYIFKIKLCSFKLFNVFFSKELFNIISHTLHLQHIPSYALEPTRYHHFFNSHHLLFTSIVFYQMLTNIHFCGCTKISLHDIYKMKRTLIVHIWRA